ncbi:MAG: glycosyltransferase [Bacteroidetes bacterium]|nr:glycosyltransferase [Bacteroidota bacterium]
MNRLTLIIPCYNSSSFIQNSFATLDNFISTRSQISLFFIDDCSADNTFELLSSLQKKSLNAARIQVQKNKINLGKGGTLKRGITEIKDGLIAFTDPDLAYDLENLDNFYSTISPKQILIANRVHPDSRYLVPPQFFRYIFTRHLSSRFLNLLGRTFLVERLEDSQAGLKMFFAEEIKPLLKLSCKNGFSFDLELLCIAQNNAIKIIQMPVNFRYDHETTTVSFLGDAMKLFSDLFHLYLRKTSGKYKLNRK